MGTNKKIIQKKLYETGKIAIDSSARKMIGSLAYQEAYRTTRNKEIAFYQVEKILTDLNISKAEIEETMYVIKSSV